MTFDRYAIDRNEMVAMVHAICDADSSLEDFKHGHRCRLKGCIIPRETCMAWKQAQAAIEALGLDWRPASDLRAELTRQQAEVRRLEAELKPRPDYRRGRMVG
jgi:hypothetical protein